MEALEKVDEYFTATARAWSLNEGRVINQQGKVVVEAEGLDELADVAGVAVLKALESYKENKK